MSKGSACYAFDRVLVCEYRVTSMRLGSHLSDNLKSGHTIEAEIPSVDDSFCIVALGEVIQLGDLACCKSSKSW